MLTRKDARLIAEELYYLMNKNGALTPAPVMADRYMGAAEAAAMLGWSVQTLYNRIKEVPHMRNGKRLTFLESAIKKYIAQRA